MTIVSQLTTIKTIKTKLRLFFLFILKRQSCFLFRNRYHCWNSSNMPGQLPADCLNEIFEYLQSEAALRPCLLVNRLWCEVSVQLLWADIQNHHTLIACLPNESKELLYENGINLLTPTSNPPLFNYVAFIKNLS